jgi:hypothetical protein
MIYCMGQGPSPQQWAHEAGLLAFSVTAKALRAFSVFFEPHEGQATLVSSDMDRTSFSNFDLQFLHVYS